MSSQTVAAEPNVLRESLGYRPALDGLRGIAAVMVVASHAHPSLFKGGALGVDVFFALSGFLITTLLLQESVAAPGRFSYRNFYIRRGLRLFPALYSVVFAVAAYLVIRRARLGDFLLAANVDEPYPWTTWAKFVAGAATYTTNLIGVTATPGNLLGHTWSLATEEQYYLIWPLVLLMAVSRRTQRTLLGALTLFIVVCFCARIMGAPSSEGFLWNRPEAIAAGSSVALVRWFSPPGRRFFQQFASPLAWLGLGTVLVSALLWGRVLTWQYERGLFPVIGVLAALMAAGLSEIGSSSLIRRLLEMRLLVWLGSISYALYLWHIPVFRIVTWELPHLSGVANVTLKVLLSVGVATVSTKYIEMPFRRYQVMFRKVD